MTADRPMPELCSIGADLYHQSSHFVTLTYIPAERSEPQERRVVSEPGEGRDYLIQRAIDESWARGDEPLEVQSEQGWSLWTNARY